LIKQSFAEVAAMEFEPVQWIVQDILPAGVSMLCAKPKQGKSWLALDLAMAVAAGSKNALGCKQAVKGDVLYFALEDNQRRMNTRLKKLIFDRLVVYD
jgi:RecA-family ATPase